jgi:hypothetical protein
MKKIPYILAALLSLFFSCKKLVEVGAPENQLTTDKIFADTASATAAVVNIYALFDKTIDPNYNKYLGLYTDELIYPGSSSFPVEFNQSRLTSVNALVSNIWSNYYFIIYSCNQVIERLEHNSKFPAGKAAALIAEAKFLRAYANFYLVNTFGPVPLILTTDVAQTVKAARADSAAVYRQIVRDLKDAQNSLPENYGGGDKVRASKLAATAMLARVALYQQNWTEAAALATSVINSGSSTLAQSPSDVFLAGSSEAILQFWTQNGYISDAASLIPGSGAPIYPVAASLLSAFEAGDLRKTSWLGSVTATSGRNAVTYYYPYKYHNRAGNTGAVEYLMALRLAEQYLIRAEANARMGNTAACVQDLNRIRERAGLPDLSPGLSTDACLAAVAQEWRTEFCLEWGHRFFDLKRAGALDAVMAADKPNWVATAALFPIPQKELTSDNSLTQNAGY